MLGHPVALASPLLWESPWGVADADSTSLLLFPWVPLLCFRGPQMFPLAWSLGRVREESRRLCRIPAAKWEADGGVRWSPPAEW